MSHWPEVPVTKIVCSDITGSPEYLDNPYPGYHAGGETIGILACDECVLFRSRRRDQMVPETGPCGCRKYTRDCGYILDARDILSSGSGFVLYKEGIRRQLEANEGFFRKRLIEIQKDQRCRGLPFEGYLHIVVHLQSGIQGVARVDVDSSSLEYWRFQNLERWRDSLARSHRYQCAGMLIVIEFQAHFPQRSLRVQFEMEMWLPFSNMSSADSMTRHNPEWRNQIMDALGDHPKTNLYLEPLFRLQGSLNFDSMYFDNVNSLNDEELEAALSSFRGLHELRARLERLQATGSGY